LASVGDLRATIIFSNAYFHLGDATKIADQFQPKLQRFRFTSFRVVRDSAFDLPQLAMPLRDVARCLGAAVEGDPELQNKLAALLQEKSDQQGVPWADRLYAAVAEALLNVSHNDKKGSVGVGQITSTVNDVLGEQGESLQLTARAVGSLLRQLGFPTSRLGAPGRGVTLLSSIRERIHRTAEGYGILGRLSAEGCSHCSERLQNEVQTTGEGEFAPGVPISKIEEKINAG
jgi:hypothetical protein